MIVLGHLTQAQRRALSIADNQLALNAGWDEDLLRQELTAALREEDFDLDLMGFQAMKNWRTCSATRRRSALASQMTTPSRR